MSYQLQADDHPWMLQTTKTVLNKNVGRIVSNICQIYFFCPLGLTFPFSTTGIEFSILIIVEREGGGDNSS